MLRLPLAAPLELGWGLEPDRAGPALCLSDPLPRAGADPLLLKPDAAPVGASELSVAIGLLYQERFAEALQLVRQAAPGPVRRIRMCSCCAQRCYARRAAARGRGGLHRDAGEV